MKGLKNWTEVTRGLYRYVIAARRQADSNAKKELKERTKDNDN